MTLINGHQMKKCFLVSLIFISTVSSYSTSGLNTTVPPDIFFTSPDDQSTDITTVTVVALRADNETRENDRLVRALDEGHVIVNTKAGQWASTHGTGKFVVIHSPDSIKFTNSKSTTETLLPYIYLASLGLSINEKAKWNGMHILDPFNMPRAVVQVSIDGYNIIERAENYTSSVRASRALRAIDLYGDDKDANIMIYPLALAKHEPNIFEEVKKRVEVTFEGNNMVNAMLSDSRSLSDIFGNPLEVRSLNLEILEHLKDTVKEDKDFLDELSNLDVVSWKVYGGAIVPNRTMVDFYDFKFTSLHPLVDHHGPDSPAVNEARSLLLEAVKMLRASFVKTYSEAVVVTLVTSDITHDMLTSRRSASSILREDDDAPRTYSPDFPVIFNLVLWLLITIGFSLVAVCQAFMKMAADMKPVYLIAPKKKDVYPSRD